MDPNPDRPLYISFAGYPINPQTTSVIAGVLSQAANLGKKNVTLLLSTPGGSVREGVSLYNFIKGLPIDIRTWNIGSVESIGNVIYVAGKVRMTTPVSSFFFHDVGMTMDGKQGRLVENNLTEVIEVIKRDRKLIVEVLTKEASIPSEKLDEWFAQGNSIRGDEAVVLGLTHEIQEVAMEDGAEVLTLAFNN
jgi:ATP-dependent Clp protease, protease subunit